VFKFLNCLEKKMTDKLVALFLMLFLLSCTSEISVETVKWSDTDIPFEINDLENGDEHDYDIDSSDNYPFDEDKDEDFEIIDEDSSETPDEDSSATLNCSNAGCSGKGFCFVNGGAPECFCQSGYHSEFPDCVQNKKGDVCSGVECSGNGSCVSVEIIEEPVCACESSYIPIGLSCIQNVSGDPCDYVDCGPNSECVFEYTTIDCKCKSGYLPDKSGWGCVEDKPDPCEKVDCGGHGECKVESGSVVCVCDKGYFYNGKTCIAVEDMSCDDIDCSGHGECVEAKGMFYCKCDEGYVDKGYECIPETGPECVYDFDCFYKCGIFMGSCVDSKCKCF